MTFGTEARNTIEIIRNVITVVCITILIITTLILIITSLILWRDVSLNTDIDMACENSENSGEAKTIVLTIEEIEGTTSRRKLLALAYRLEADARAGDMTPGQYTELSLLLGKKLGFGITEDNLSKAVEELESESR